MAGDPNLWLEEDIIRYEWPDGADLPDEVLATVVKAAQEQIVEYAPASLTAELDDLALPITIATEDPYTESADSAAFPPRLRVALIMQAREVWRASEREGDVLGVGEFTVRASDMTSAVRKLLRPRKGKPAFR